MRVYSTVAALALVFVLVACGALPPAAPSPSLQVQRPTAAAPQLAEYFAAAAPVAVSLTLDLQRPPRPNRSLLEYQVGVDYHAWGPDFIKTAFLTQYHLAGVRDTVRGQLQGMADAGASLIFTRIWFVTEPGTTDFDEKWRAGFPMTDQEQANLRAYAQDVAAVVGTKGNRLRLNLCTLWLGAADYTRGTLETGLGFTPLLPAEYTRRVELTTDKLLAAVSDIVRPDGIHVVDSVFLNGELMINVRPNEAWFMLAHYPRFVQAVQQAGLQPSVYFIANGSQALLLQDDFIDYEFPIVNGHASMWSMYPSLKFMVDNHMYIPPRIDFSWYITDPEGAPFAKLLTRTLNDADAVLPSLGVPTYYGAAETHYFLDPVQRRQLGLAFVNEAGKGRLQRVQFWTTPDGAAPGVGAAYPFALSDYLP